MTTVIRETRLKNVTMSQYMAMISCYISEIFNEERNNRLQLYYQNHHLWNDFIRHLSQFSSNKGILVICHFRQGSQMYFEPIIHNFGSVHDFIKKHQYSLCENDIIEDYILFEKLPVG